MTMTSLEVQVEHSSRSAAVEQLKMDNILQIPHTGQENVQYKGHVGMQLPKQPKSMYC